jgi:hypothetical protein
MEAPKVIMFSSGDTVENIDKLKNQGNFLVVFDPIYGKGYKDGTVLKEILEDYNKNLDFVHAGSSNYIYGVRLLCFHKQIPFDKVIFLFENKIIKMDKDCRIANWPKGFADFLSDVLSNMF